MFCLSSQKQQNKKQKNNFLSHTLFNKFDSTFMNNFMLCFSQGSKLIQGSPVELYPNSNCVIMRAQDGLLFLYECHLTINHINVFINVLMIIILH